MCTVSLYIPARAPVKLPKKIIPPQNKDDNKSQVNAEGAFTCVWLGG